MDGLLRALQKGLKGGHVAQALFLEKGFTELQLDEIEAKRDLHHIDIVISCIEIDCMS